MLAFKKSKNAWNVKKRVFLFKLFQTVQKPETPLSLVSEAGIPLIPKYYLSKIAVEQSHLGTNEIICNTANEFQNNMCHGKVRFIQRITQYIGKCITVTF